MTTGSPNATDRRAIVAMSGGVDSSVAAALLTRQGYDVLGVTLRLVPDEADRSVFEPCCSLEAADDARRVADRLGFPHRTVNCVDAFERYVIADFLNEYREGRTPNPCVRCNRYIKFGVLWDIAQGDGAQYVATGHYARLGERDGRRTLSRALYRAKDQSYALACLTQDQLAHALFPLGDLSKDETREMARSLELATAERPESQEICFIPDDDYRRFLAERTGAPRPGPIITRRGEVLGEHKGLPFYTVGQRKGLGIAAPRPYYVLQLDPERNALVVGHEEETVSDVLVARQVNWVSMAPQSESFEAEVKIRYRHRAASATVTPENNALVVHFREPQRSITPGQWAVLYREDEVLAAGVIDEFALR